MDRHEAILLLGPTASGKTPLGERLAARGLDGRACVHFDFGARLRRIAAGRLRPACLTNADVAFVRRVLDEGALLEDEQFRIAEAILTDFLVGNDPAADARVVLNGLPRHIGQARDLSALLDVRTLVELRCDAETVLRRIRADAGGDRARRSDDDLDAVRARLELYANRTAPLVAWYADRGARVVVLDVDAKDRPDDARRKLERA